MAAVHILKQSRYSTNNRIERMLGDNREYDTVSVFLFVLPSSVCYWYLVIGFLLLPDG